MTVIDFLLMTVIDFLLIFFTAVKRIDWKTMTKYEVSPCVCAHVICVCCVCGVYRSVYVVRVAS